MTAGGGFSDVSLYTERFWPYAAALIGLLIWRYIGIALPEKENLLASSLTIGAIITGFLATAKAILMALDSDVMKRIRSTNYLSDLVSYIAQAIWSSLLFCFVSLFGYFINPSSSFYGYVWIFVGLTMAANFVRVTKIMLRILKYPSRP